MRLELKRRLRSAWRPVWEYGKWVLAFQLIGGIASYVCAGNSTAGFHGDRARDMGDVFTLTVGFGGGATVRCGPAHLGLFYGADHAGVRNGQFVTRDLETMRTIDPFVVGFPWLEWNDGWCFYNDVCMQDTYAARARGKLHNVDSRVPVVAWPNRDIMGRRYP